MIDTTGCVGSSMMTRSGKWVSFAQPDISTINIDDIAYALSHINRYTGHAGSYSVAEHCCHCYDVARRAGEAAEICFTVLMHDAAEAYIGDVSRPLKNLLPAFRVIEQKLENAIAEKFDIIPFKEKVKLYDNQLLKAEKNYLFPGCDDWGLGNIADVLVDFYTVQPSRFIMDQFMLRFRGHR